MLSKRELSAQNKIIETVAMFSEEASVIEGVVRWNSNGSIPPDEILEIWQNACLDFNIDASKEMRKIDHQKFFEQYRIRQANRSQEQIEEQNSEARVAFGSGVDVINVITGERRTTGFR